MEESKLRTHRRPSVGSGRPERRGASAASSSHVIDLRAAKPMAPETAPPAPKPTRKSKVPRRPLAAPNQSAAPVKVATSDADEPETPAKTKASAPPLASVAPISPSSSMSEPTLPPRRFWPAFWRFLLLLVILALLVVGGVYLYINYYRG